MKKNKIVIITLVLIVLVGILIIIYHNNFVKVKEEELIYSTRYSFAFGSRGVKIYQNGAVYDDLEIEEPNHVPNYKYLKTLTKNDVDDLKDKIEKETNSELIKNYVINLVYGVEEFDNFGNY